MLMLQGKFIELVKGICDEIESGLDIEKGLISVTDDELSLKFHDGPIRYYPCCNDMSYVGKTVLKNLVFSSESPDIVEMIRKIASVLKCEETCDDPKEKVHDNLIMDKGLKMMARIEIAIKFSLN